MTVASISEYAGSAVQSSDVVQVPVGPPLATYDINLTAGSVTGPQFQPATRLVRINVDSIARIAMGPVGTVTAAASGGPGVRFSANQTEYWGVPVQGFALAAITSST